MKICFPVQKDEGFESAVYGHFGSAPLFVVVDTDTSGLSTISNRDQNHAHGACSPMKALDGRRVDAIIVGGIGAGALTRLNQMGIRVHRSVAETVRENIAIYASRGLPELTLQGCCGGHAGGTECAHS